MEFVQDSQQWFESIISRYVPAGTSPQALYDIGVGSKTEWQTLGSIYPGMCIFGCEPDPVQFQRLLAQGLNIKPVAIGTDRSAVLHIPSDRMSSSLFSLEKLYGNPTVELKTVEMQTLDEFDDWAGKPHDILLWLDIEGSELDALRSGPNLLRSGRVKWLNLEERCVDARAPYRDWPSGWSHPHDLTALLNSYGYQRVLEYNYHGTHQDVIYVYRD